MSDSRAVTRASLSLRCLPFRRAFYDALSQGAISSTDLAGHLNRDRLLSRSATAEQLEQHFIWLIRLGVLRREVDGQGLTERVRLTPLGRQVLQTWSGEIPPPSWPGRLRHWWRRRRPRL